VKKEGGKDTMSKGINGGPSSQRHFSVEIRAGGGRDCSEGKRTIENLGGGQGKTP